eukprot:CAMPEP_0177792860 /NCGR_PEP_ID=MMETSP0491_2-20121128/24751_1 /TAXON_ID=63592 /ORGANISM="Tetraselmis chuii, Strain PLY429" /LENGTH=709 /DNA_ID=CAMNT_0019315305 /DNA_START=417 /DNA_END=2547 /DNA_ORIENTATION=-
MLNELAEKSFDQQDCYVIFAIVELRLGYPPDKWRNVYKALTVLEFIMKRGSDTWVTLSQDVMPSKLEALEDFKYFDEKGHDQGVNVRHRAAAIRALLASPRVLVAEREAAAKKRRQYSGYSRDDMKSSGGGYLQTSSRDSYDPYSYSSQSRQEAPGYGRIGDDDDNGNSQLQYHWDGPSPREASNSGSSASRRQGQNAGEMKGVTLEENKRNLARLKGILARPENRLCADCSGASSSRPTWASINTGVFICMQCAGIHRGLGVHISKVRSCTLDTWLPEQVAFLDATGNAIANSYWEANLPLSEKPNGGDSQQLAAFIRTKYSGQWAQGEWPPSDAWSASRPTATVAPAPAPAAVQPAPVTAAAPAPRLQQPARQQSSAFAAPQSQRPTPSNGAQGTSGGTFWSNFQSSNSPVSDPPPPQPQRQPQQQQQRRNMAPPVNSKTAPPPAPPPVPTFDLLSFDDDVPASQPPASPAFSDANWGSTFTAAPVAAAPPAASHTPPPEYDLLSLMDDLPPRPVPPPPVAQQNTPPAFQEMPLVQMQQHQCKIDLGVGSTMAGIEELAQSPNIMDAQELYMPSPEQQTVMHGDATLPEVQLTGASVLPGLDDLLNYQYTGVDTHGSSRLGEPARQPYNSNMAGYHGNSNMYPQPQSRQQQGRTSWHATDHGHGSSAGVTHFDSLQDDFLNSLKLTSPASANNGYRGTNQPMRAVGR